MGWEERKGRRYYYRKRRTTDGHIRSEYVGAGELARLAATMDAMERDERERAWEEWREQRQHVQERERSIREVSAGVRALTTVALLASGYHTHKGEWRWGRQNGMGQDMHVEKHFDLMETPVEFQEFVRLVERTNKERPSKADVAALRRVLETHPEYWRSVAHLAESVTDRILQDASLYPVPVQEALRAGLKEIRKDLGMGEASPLEKLLIREVALCWLDHHTVQLRHQGATKGSHNMGQGAYWDKRASGAQRRYLRAVEALARVKRLGLGAIQINIAEQQVNVAG